MEEAEFMSYESGDTVVAYGDGTKVLFWPSGKAAFLFPLEKFTDKKCKKNINGKDYWTATFIPEEIEIFLKGLANTIGKEALKNIIDEA